MASRYVDLTGPLNPHIWSYRSTIEDLPPIEHRRWATIDDRGYEADWFAMPTLAGTYLETAKHLFAGAPSIDQVPVERFFVNATIARIPKTDRGHITATDLESAIDGLNPGDALIVATGWEQFSVDSERFVGQSPHFDLEAMQWITGQQVSILAGDMPCFDDPVGEEAQAVNVELFGSGALILAPLANLARVNVSRGRLVVLPIPLTGSCGAPCRAVLIED